ncbi:MAG: hypothetical protein KME03_06605 [Aphanocapsa lilacina HA4352-LM1]|jgi:hypothetical protein|nr:hypothetical protein [Aphanocapsa lilacina HA4352-LM1]
MRTPFGPQSLEALGLAEPFTGGCLVAGHTASFALGYSLIGSGLGCLRLEQ